MIPVQWLAGAVLLVPLLASDAQPKNAQIRATVTTADRTRLLAELPVRPSRSAPALRVEVDAGARFQEMSGFGAALTDASVQLIGALPPTARQTLLHDLFSPTGGAGFSLVRVPIGASDFSPEHYTLADAAPGAADTALRSFRFTRERTRLQLLRDVRAIQPALMIMATPWSAPAWMKQPATLNGGTLRDEAMPYFARYLVRVVQSYDSAGLPLALLSVQNEPQHAPADYPGMRLTSAQRAALIGRHLGPALGALARAPRLLEWDHNWDAPQEPLAVLADSVARRHVRGVAWHCYAGDVQAQSRVHEAFPELDTWFTECAGGAWAPSFGDNLLWNAKTLVVGATRHHARGVMLWNLALDPAGGPHLGGCTNCRGVVTIDPVTQRVTRNEEYYALAHAGRFVRQGAVRVQSRVMERAPAADGVAERVAAGIADVAFVNPDGELVLILVNERTRVEPVGVAHAVVELPARSVVTLRVKPR